MTTPAQHHGSVKHMLQRKSATTDKEPYTV